MTLLALLSVVASVQAGSGRPPEMIWQSSCSYCHQRSKIGPSIEKGVEPDFVKSIVRSGAGAMPPFHPSEIDDAELDALATWLRSGKQADVKAR